MVNAIKDTDLKEIIEGCRNNDNAMQTKLYYVFYPVMYTTVSRYITDDIDKDDILQEAFIKVFKHIKKLKDEKLVVPWMKRIAVNLCMDKFKADKRAHLSFDLYVKNLPDLKETDDFDVDGMGEITIEDVNEVLDQLPNGFKTVFMLYAIENYSHKEIAQYIGTSESNSKTQYMRAKLAIKNLVKQKLECKKMK